MLLIQFGSFSLCGSENSIKYIYGNNIRLYQGVGGGVTTHMQSAK